MKKFRNNKNKGFTLIELIVVISILTILVITAVPKMTRHITKAKLIYIQSDMKTIDSVVKTLEQLKQEYKDGLLKESEIDIVNTAITEDKVFRDGHKIQSNEVLSGEYFKIKDNVVRDIAGSKLEGSFFVDADSTLYYVVNEKVKGLEVDENSCANVEFDGMEPASIDINSTEFDCFLPLI